MWAILRFSLNIYQHNNLSSYILVLVILPNRYAWIREVIEMIKLLLQQFQVETADSWPFNSW